MINQGKLEYVGGKCDLSYVELDKVSLPEIQGHLADHVVSKNFMRLHWLKPGAELSNGLVLLVDDASCLTMVSHITDAGVAEIYVEEVVVCLQMVEQPSKESQGVSLGDAADCGRGKQIVEDEDGGSSKQIEDNRFAEFPVEDKEEDTETESLDKDYFQPIEDDSSGEDDEAIDFRKYANEVKRNIRAKKLGLQSGGIGHINPAELVDEVPNLDDPGSPYHDSSEEYSYEENSEGESKRWLSQENRYDSKAPVPMFSLGMAFRCSRQFKKALVKYGLKAHKHLHFQKDEKNRVRANCSWPGCKWLIYGSKTTRSDWFKVVTFIDEHSCPPRRDNRLVTSNIIAKHYFSEIKDNPTWKVELIKKAVLKDLLADVSLSKCKRAKALVLKVALDSMKGEYSKVYDYQLELLRSNPGSTVVVYLNPEFEDQVFERFYVCFDACKKGFLAGCRKVIGLDGCWFKGSNTGQLLCAIGRDANNQMYPIAWAAVATETYDSWYWFLGLLQKDLNINIGGDGWVVISDQQKVHSKS